MTVKLPWMPLYTDRLLGSRRVRMMNATRFGIYMSLLIEEWDTGPLPDDDTELRLAGRASIDQVRAVLARHFLDTPSGWVNEVLEEIRAEQVEKHRKRVVAGRKGGRSKARAMLEQRG